MNFFLDVYIGFYAFISHKRGIKTPHGPIQLLPPWFDTSGLEEEKAIETLSTS